MSDNDDALYERIVRMIPVDALQNSYNSVIQDGISSVNDAVDGAVAALAHLKEVRDAVDKLGQDRPQRSKNLLNTMNRTMALQLELELALQTVIQVENTAIRTRKRSFSADSSRSGISKGYSNIESNAGSEDKAIVTTGRLHLGRDRDGCDGLRKRSGEVVVENQKRMKLSSENATSVGTSRILNLQPLVEEKKTSTYPVEIADCAKNISVKTSEQYLEMMKKIAEMSAIERFPYVREILLEVADVADKKGRTSLQKEHAVIFVKTVIKWPLRDKTNQKSLVDVYRRFLKSMESYEGQMVSTKDKAELKSLLTTFAWAVKVLESRLSKPKGSAVITQSQSPVARATKPQSSSPLLELTKANCLEKLRMMTQSSVDARNKYLSDVLAKLLDMITVSEHREQVSILKYVLLWATLSAGSGDDLEAYDQFCKRMTTILDKIPNRDRRAALARQNSLILALLKDHATKSREAPTETSLNYDLMVFHANSMAPNEKGKCILQIFNSLKKDMARDTGANAFEILTGLRQAKQWVHHDPSIQELCGDLVQHIELYRGVVPASMFKARVFLTSEIQHYKAIAGMKHIDDSDTVLKGILVQVKQLGEASEEQRLLQLDECILMLGAIVLRAKRSQRKQTVAVVECYELLLKCVERLPPLSRNQRRHALQKWMGLKRKGYLKKKSSSAS